MNLLTVPCPVLRFTYPSGLLIPLCSAETVEELSYYKETEKKTDAEEASFNMKQMKEKMRWIKVWKWPNPDVDYLHETELMASRISGVQQQKFKAENSYFTTQTNKF